MQDHYPIVLSSEVASFVQSYGKVHVVEVSDGVSYLGLWKPPVQGC